MKNHLNSIDIYLDLNIYISIAKREPIHDYLISKINSLHKLDVTFPHSPAHAEELSALRRSGRDPITAHRMSSLFKKYNNNIGYAPGLLNENEALEASLIYRQQAGHNDKIALLSEYFLKIALDNRSGKITEKDYATQRISEEFDRRVEIAGTKNHFNDFAINVETYFLGRRNSESLKKNFSTINEPIDNIKTFEDIHKEYKIGPRLISEIKPEKIFSHEGIERYAEVSFKENNLDYKKIPSPEIFKKSHHKKEEYITVLMNLLEKSGYKQEKKNHEASITGRMHDVSHSIYASQADYFVTNDERLGNKTAATYYKLGIPTKVLSIDDFLTLSLENEILYL
jgi:hypothetical protein